VVSPKIGGKVSNIAEYPDPAFGFLFYLYAAYWLLTANVVGVLRVNEANALTANYIHIEKFVEL
jgi:hypothetical protein